MRPRGPFPLPTAAPARDTCDVCGGPAGIARVLGATTHGVWCGTGCAEGCRAGDLGVGEKVAVLAARFPEVLRWPAGQSRAQHEAHLSRRAVVAKVGPAAVVLANARGRPRLAELTVPPDFPCTRFTGVVPLRDPEQHGHLLRRWPDDGTWTRDVPFGLWVSHLPQGLCEDAEDCAEPATLWVCYGADADAPSCERCLARRRMRRRVRQPHHIGVRRPLYPYPVAAWDAALGAWDVRAYDQNSSQAWRS